MINQHEGLKKLNEDAVYYSLVNKGYSEWRSKAVAAWMTETVM